MDSSKKKKTPLLVFSVILILALVALDQWTKWAVVQNIALYEKIPMISGFFDLTYVQNTGAAFSMFEGMGMWFFIILTVAALGAMVYFIVKNDNPGIELSVALIAAGALGNLIDRILYGYVRDFFLFYIFGSPFPVFNVADICITVGFILLVFFMLKEDWDARKAVKQNDN